MATTTPRARRTQAERTAETREALIEATIRLLHEKGYSGTSTELVSEVAGVSRGALRHHFPTRVQLMAEVISTVYAQESEHYDRMAAETGRGSLAADWPELLWEVMSRPSGLAVLEILQASRSDPALAELVAPAQAKVESMSLAAMQQRYGLADLAAIRFFVWAVRGLSLARMLVADPAEIERSVAFFRNLVTDAARINGNFGMDAAHAPDTGQA